MAKNATSFKKGDPRINTKGKPKGAISLVTKMREALDAIHDGTQKPYHELLVASILKDGIKADGQSRRLMLQYLEGMPRETKEIEANITIVAPSDVIKKLNATDTETIGGDIK